MTKRNFLFILLFGGIFILSGSLWDIEHVLFTANRFAQSDHVAFLCNYDNRSAARRIVFMKNADTKKVFCVNPEALTATVEEGESYTGCIVGGGTQGEVVIAFYCGTCSISTIIPNGDGLCRSN